MHPTDIIRRPLLTEKTTFGSDAFNRYAFQVDSRATKDQIKKAAESLYSIRVVGVATQNRKGQLRRNRHGNWRAARMKIATIKVHPEDRIELL